MKKITQDIKELTKRYVAGTASADEIAHLGEWLKSKTENTTVFNQYKIAAREEADIQEEANEAWSRFVDKYEIKDQYKGKNRIFISLVSLAATVFILLGISLQLFNSTTDNYTAMLSDEVTESKQTILQLADGNSVSINEKHANIKVDNGGQKFILDNNQIVKSSSSEETKSVLNRLEVPYGKTAQVTLADGTKVWLNAGSQLVFPSRFTDADRRDVMLKGEGYFDVTHNKHQPFRVLTNEIAYTVLGTAFNIRAFKHEQKKIAVLVNGSLQVEERVVFNKQRLILEPGQMSLFDKKKQLNVREVNTNIYTSWKDGYLTLEKNSLRLLVYQIEQFYNCDIKINDKFLNRPTQLTGKLMLDENAELVYQALSDLTGLNFSINDEDVIFYKEKS